MTDIFISYRREDSADATGRISDRLYSEFGQDNIFKDIDTIPLGLDFRELIDREVGRCEVFLAIIGPDWLDARDKNGETRLEQNGDFIRIEVESALKRGIPLVPVLIGGATMPTEEQLPRGLKKLAFRNATPVRADQSFEGDMNRLVSGIKQLKTVSVEDKPGSRQQDFEPQEKPETITRRGRLSGILFAIAGLLGIFWLVQYEPTGKNESSIVQQQDVAIPIVATEIDTEDNKAEVKKLLAKARQQIDSSRLTIPLGDNALETIRQTQQLEPNNTVVSSMLDEIVDLYVELAEAAEAKNNFETATGFLDKARLVNTNSARREKLVQAGHRVQKKRTDKDNLNARVLSGEIRKALALARRQIDENNLSLPAGNNALETLLPIQKADPSNTAASAMLDEILDRFIEMAENAQDSQDFDKASFYIEKAMAIETDSIKLKQALQSMDGALN